MKLPRFTCFCAILAISGCSQTEPEPILFAAPVAVTVTGYKGDNLMEPFLTRDGKYLLFNNLNHLPENTNLHWAAWKSNQTFEYKGEISGVNTDVIEGTPTMDKAGNLYFVSPRSYATSLSSIYTATFLNGVATNVSLVDGISKKQPGIVNFDVEINASGDTMYFVDGEYSATESLTAADIVIAKKTGTVFGRLANSNDILKNINTDQLEYAASISSDDLTLYFTRVAVTGENPMPQIFYATREKVDDVFGVPVLVPGLGDFVEAPSIYGKLLYYHRSVNGAYKLFLAKKGH